MTVRRRATMAAIITGAALAGSSLLLVESVGPILAIAFWVVAALLFGNWYRTSTTPAGFDTAATILDAHTLDGVTLNWTTEGATSYGAPAAAQDVTATR